MPVFWHWEISPKPHRTSYSDPTTERPEKFQGKLVTVTAPRGNSGVKSIAGTIAKNTTVKIHQGPQGPARNPTNQPHNVETQTFLCSICPGISMFPPIPEGCIVGPEPAGQHSTYGGESLQPLLYHSSDLGVEVSSQSRAATRGLTHPKANTETLPSASDIIFANYPEHIS